MRSGKKTFHISHFTFHDSCRQGQVMLMTVLVMSAVFLSATVIAGLLMVYQLSQVTRVVDSAKAIFAADTAIERGSFRVFKCNTPSNIETVGNIPIADGGVPTWDVTATANTDLCGFIANADPATPSAKSFFNDATYKLGFAPNAAVSEDDFDEPTDPYMIPPPTEVSVKAVGIAGNSVRAVKKGLSF